MPAAPTYLDLADSLESELRDARPGTRVASEHELAARYRVSRPTARAVLQELERRYVVRRQRGSGTFVHHRLDYVVGPSMPPSGTETFARSGVRSSARVLSIRTRVAHAVERRHLELDSGDRVCVVRRQGDADGMLTNVSTAVVRCDLAPGLASHVRDGVSLFGVLRDDYGLEPVRRWTRASLEVPPAAIASELELEGRPPTWLLEGVSQDATSGAAIEFTQSWFRADLIRVVFEMGVPEHGKGVHI